MVLHVIIIILLIGFALHRMHFLAYGVMSPLDSSDSISTTSFIVYNDAASYLVEYEGRRHDICIEYAL